MKILLKCFIFLVNSEAAVKRKYRNTQGLHLILYFLFFNKDLSNMQQLSVFVFCFFKFIYLFIYFWLCWVFVSVRGLSPVAASGGHSSSRCAGLSPSRLSCCGAQAPDAQAQQLWLTGLVAPRHVGSSQTRARTRVPCISRQTLNHCATREA